MIEIYGGLRLENLAAQDRYFGLQCNLFHRRFIQGVQLRVAHHDYTPDLALEALPNILRRLPEGMKVFVHFGAENVGVDFGRVFDECGVCAQRVLARRHRWKSWNKQTLEWGFRVASHLKDRIERGFPWGVVHPGYGKSLTDGTALEHIVTDLKNWGSSDKVAIENVPAWVDRVSYEAVMKTKTMWPRDNYWGFGGTPGDMRRLLVSLGKGWRCLLDFTHLKVTVNQAKVVNLLVLYSCRSLERVVERYLALPHWPICHFSGIPPDKYLSDTHDFIGARPLPPIRDAIRTMRAVCLEFRYEPGEAERIIETFRENYLD